MFSLTFTNPLPPPHPVPTPANLFYRFTIFVKIHLHFAQVHVRAYTLAPRHPFPPPDRFNRFGLSVKKITNTSPPPLPPPPHTQTHTQKMFRFGFFASWYKNSLTLPLPPTDLDSLSKNTITPPPAPFSQQKPKQSFFVLYL